MLIQIVFDNGQKGRVTEEMLSYLLETGGIISFKRKSGWVRPDRDHVRVKKTLIFSIPERRAAVNALLESDAPLPFSRVH